MRGMVPAVVRRRSVIDIRPAGNDEVVSQVRVLFKEYGSSLGVALSFQDFARELADLPGPYTPPWGALLVAHCDGRLAGCVALRPSGEGTCEMKRLYVRPPGTGRGTGAALASAILERARSAGYRRVRLDTLPSMATAQQLYRRLGFREIGPYRHNPVPGSLFMELDLAAPPSSS